MKKVLFCILLVLAIMIHPVQRLDSFLVCNAEIEDAFGDLFWAYALSRGLGDFNLYFSNLLDTDKEFEEQKWVAGGGPAQNRNYIYSENSSMNLIPGFFISRRINNMMLGFNVISDIYSGKYNDSDYIFNIFVDDYIRNEKSENTVKNNRFDMTLFMSFESESFSLGIAGGTDIKSGNSEFIYTDLIDANNNEAWNDKYSEFNVFLKPSVSFEVKNHQFVLKWDINMPNSTYEFTGQNGFYEQTYTEKSFLMFPGFAYIFDANSFQIRTVFNIISAITTREYTYHPDVNEDTWDYEGKFSGFKLSFILVKKLSSGMLFSGFRVNKDSDLNIYYHDDNTTNNAYSYYEYGMDFERTSLVGGFEHMMLQMIKIRGAVAWNLLNKNTTTNLEKDETNTTLNNDTMIENRPNVEISLGVGIKILKNSSLNISFRTLLNTDCETIENIDNLDLNRIDDYKNSQFRFSFDFIL